jgi:hypothetical protein
VSWSVTGAKTGIYNQGPRPTDLRLGVTVPKCLMLDTWSIDYS